MPLETSYFCLAPYCTWIASSRASTATPLGPGPRATASTRQVRQLEGVGVGREWEGVWDSGREWEGVYGSGSEYEGVGDCGREFMAV
ncbi:hypothetical protein E2C01_094098 [Portunus trituberculatus]|uniref:Uncharacterized protein n=1 Tax=Portunus trituberculatus TaxID=210409 RepID=A0A5B7JZX0_PORTR|nr:hypothetical protein [Portunus trituberculatus]